MAAPTLTNGTILNTANSDVTLLTQNDNDLLNSVTDGTKDLTFGTIDLNTSPGVLTNLLPTDSTYDLGSTTYGWRALYLDNSATNGGSVFFDGSNTSYLQSSADGLTLSMAGFTSFSITGNIYTTAYTDYSGSSTIVGWAASPTTELYYKKVGLLYFVVFRITGTSNSTSTTFTLPVAVNANSRVDFFIRAVDNTGTAVISFGEITANSSTVNLYSSAGAGAWTATGTKTVQGQFFFEGVS